MVHLEDDRAAFRGLGMPPRESPKKAPPRRCDTGEKVVMTYDIRTGSGQPGAPLLRVTPVALWLAAVCSPSRAPVPFWSLSVASCCRFRPDPSAHEQQAGALRTGAVTPFCLALPQCCWRPTAVSYTHLRAHETDSYLVCRLLLEK